jgi:hypothetical protein
VLAVQCWPVVWITLLLLLLLRPVLLLAPLADVLLIILLCSALCFSSPRLKLDGPYDSKVLPVLLAVTLITSLVVVFSGAIARLHSDA